ncbi:MAG: hypothetical protein ACOYJD_01200 [Christensenellales bacterium]|jgi:hypothetical protein
MEKLPLVVIKPAGEGLIRLNDSVVGHAGPKKPVSSPIYTEGALYVIFTPLSSIDNSVFSPCALKIEFSDGKPSSCSEFGKIALWPGNIYEITITPPLLALPSRPVSEIYGICRANWEAVRGRTFMVTVYDDNGLHLAIEDTASNRLLFTHFLGSGEPTLDFIDTGTSPQLELAVKTVSGQTTRFTVVSYFDGGFRLMFDEAAARISFKNGVISAEYDKESGFDFPVKKIFELRDGIFVASGATPGLDAPSSHSDAAMTFFEAVRLDMEQAALALLTPSLRSGLTYSDIVSFLGSFYSFGPALFPTDHSAIQIALKYEGDANLDAVRVFTIELVSRTDEAGEWKIDNIREL